MSDTPEWDDVVEQLARPRIDRLQADVDYWEERAIKAEDEIEQLRMALKEIAESRYQGHPLDIQEFAFHALEGKT